MGRALRAFSGLRGDDLCLNTTATAESSAPSVPGRTPRLLKDLWDDAEAATLESQPLELLRYRSNLLGADLRITNFGGGNTSSKFDLPDPLTGAAARASWR